MGLASGDSSEDVIGALKGIINVSKEHGKEKSHTKILLSQTDPKMDEEQSHLNGSTAIANSDEFPDKIVAQGEATSRVQDVIEDKGILNDTHVLKAAPIFKLASNQKMLAKSQITPSSGNFSLSLFCFHLSFIHHVLIFKAVTSIELMPNIQEIATETAGTSGNKFLCFFFVMMLLSGAGPSKLSFPPSSTVVTTSTIPEGLRHSFEHTALYLITHYLKTLQSKQSLPSVEEFFASSEGIFRLLSNFGVLLDVWKELSYKILTTLEQIESMQKSSHDHGSSQYGSQLNEEKGVLQGLNSLKDALQGKRHVLLTSRQSFVDKMERIDEEVSKLLEEKSLISLELEKTDGDLADTKITEGEVLGLIEKSQLRISSLEESSKDAYLKSVPEHEAAFQEIIQDFLSSHA